MAKRFSGKQIATMSLATALIAAGAFIRIPLGMDMYITMQVFFVVLSGYLVGRASAASAFVYMVLGLVGIPIFAAGGGFYYIFKSTFGYIIGFVAAAYIIGTLTKKQDCSYIRYLLSGLLGVAVIYIIGITYLYFIVTLYLGKSVTAEYIFITLFLTTIWKDILVTVLAAAIAKKIRRLVRQ